jgi:3-oxoacyl-[acyl-carrier-protein] synthase II
MAMTMSIGLRDAGMKPSDVDYIMPTRRPFIGDPVEVTAIRTVFKQRADQLVVNATKSLIGHTLGAGARRRRLRQGAAHRARAPPP